MGIFTKIFSKAKDLEPIDLSVLGTDVHSHLIPGIDDGSKSLDDSIRMIERLMEMGFEKIITTPHIMSDLYPNSRDIILKGYENVKNELEKRKIKVEFEVAAEYFLDDHFVELIKKDEIMTFGDNYVLFELPFGEQPMNLKKVIFDLQMNGYIPVLAHPERYPYWHKSMNIFHELLVKDVILQINMNSLSGAYGPQVKNIGEKLIQEKLVKLIGSDAHHVGHLDLMQQSSKSSAIHELINSGRLLNKTL